MKKIIYDFGSNNGDEIEYYLLKSDLVIAIEANPVLSKQIEKRFASAIAENKLVVENCVVTIDDKATEVDFYIHKNDDGLSQFPKPSIDLIDRFAVTRLPSKSVNEIITQYGSPYYIKIDIEHYDAEILRNLYKLNIIPPYISAETHTIEVFSLMVTMGYDAFKLINGETVPKVYNDFEILTAQGEKRNFTFPANTAGPFGDDVQGKWMKADNFYRLLAFEGLGWKDIHATSMIEADSKETVSIRPYCRRGLINNLKELFKLS